MQLRLCSHPPEEETIISKGRGGGCLTYLLAVKTAVLLPLRVFKLTGPHRASAVSFKALSRNDM